MIEGLIMVEGDNLNSETLRTVSLMNAKQVVIGSVPSLGTILHLAANSADDFGTAMREFAGVRGVTSVLTLLLKAWS